jgi:hypothetical protein
VAGYDVYQLTEVAGKCSGKVANYAETLCSFRLGDWSYRMLRGKTIGN